MSILTFSYDDDGTEGYGWTQIEIRSDVFSGRGGFWAYPDGLLEFADSLSAFPIDSANPPEFRSYPAENPLVVMRVEPADSVGHLSLLLTLTDSVDNRNKLSVVLETSYAAMAKLQRSLREFASHPDQPIGVDIG